jgi:hypothetical protein
MEMRSRGRLLMCAASLTLMAGSMAAFAEDWGRKPAEEKPTLNKLVDVGGNGLGAFDISFVDPKIELYILADRTNGSIDLLDSEHGQFLGRIGSVCTAATAATHFCFQGVVLNPPVPPATVGTANNSKSGPDGDVIVDHKEIWAGDGDSRIKVIDIATKSFVTTISTGGKLRVDEMAYDPKDHILAAANNADTPPFVTLFDTNKKTILGQMVFATSTTGSVCVPAPAWPCTAAGVDAQNGIEQPQYSPRTGLFYMSVPQVGATLSTGGVSVIDPHTMKVLRTLLVSNCSPAGLAIGPHNEALIGCSGSFGTPATTVSKIIDLTSTDTALDAAVVATVPIGGSDEVWYDPGTVHYFLAARSNLDSSGKADPILGSIDAISHTVDPSDSTSTTAHSVAADKDSHLVFVPIGLVPSTAASGTDPTNPCPKNGCIAVYRAHSEDQHRFADRDDHHDHDDNH